MSNRADMERTIRDLWSARLKGDLEGTTRGLTEDAVFGINGRGTGVAAMSTPCCGMAEVKPVLQGLIDNFTFDDWKQLDLLIDGETAFLHWTARVTCKATGKSDDFEVFDLIRFRDGKIVEYRQCTDTALLVSVATPS
jgi:ketosteroid isomerase-like protein